MEPERSLSCSQELFLYPHTAEFRLYSNSVTYIIALYLVFHLYLGITSGLFPFGFQTNLWYALLSPPLCNVQR
jgi:hypothetical protein